MSLSDWSAIPNAGLWPPGIVIKNDITPFNAFDDPVDSLAVQANIGEISVTLVDASLFANSGGLRINAQNDILYTSKLGNVLSGIPNSGPGSITSVHAVTDIVSFRNKAVQVVNGAGIYSGQYDPASIKNQKITMWMEPNLSGTTYKICGRIQADGSRYICWRNMNFGGGSSFFRISKYINGIGLTTIQQWAQVSDLYRKMVFTVSGDELVTLTAEFSEGASLLVRQTTHFDAAIDNAGKFGFEQQTVSAALSHSDRPTLEEVVIV